jgi:zinc protease
MRKFALVIIAGLILSLTTAAQVKVAPLNIRERTLSNGLHVVSLQDDASPMISIHVLYDVGSKNDPTARNGFAHLFEHIMFKSTKNMKSEMMDRLTEDVGGLNNASTWDDFTNYYEVIPPNYLQTLIWAEAERMSNLTVDEANFKSERAVVEEEFRQSVLSQPYGMFNEYIQKLSYSTHPYMRTTIGTIADLESATLKDVQNFHDTYYRPDNAYFIVVGDFEQNQLDGWVDQYFGKLKKPGAAIPRVTAVEPPRTKEQRFAETAPNVPFPAVAITYLGPRSTDPDIPAIRVAEKILSGGQSSRLYQSLVYKQHIAQEASFNLDNRVEGGLLYFIAVASEGNTPEKLEKALLEELNRIQLTGVTAAELTKAKNQLVADAVRGRETDDGKAVAIERSITYQHDPKAVNADIQKLQDVTAADVQRAMKKYFSDNDRVVIYYGNEGGTK